VQTVEPVPPNHLRPNLPRDLTTICLKCLQKDPARRYAAAEALAEDLQRFLAGMPIKARPVGTLERTWRWCRRNRAVAALIGSVALLLVVIAIGSSLTALYLHATVKESDRNRKAAVQANRQGREKLWLSLRDQARASQKAGQRFESLKVVQEAVALARELQMPQERLHELRNIAIASLVLPGVEVIKEWDGYPSGSGEVDFAGTLEHYARSDSRGAVSVRRVSDDAEIARLPGSGSPTTPRFSPDGRFLAVFVDGTDSPVRVWKLGGEQPVVVFEEPASAGHLLDFSPDNRDVAIGHKDGTISVRDLATRQLLRRLKTHPLTPYKFLKFHPQGRLLAVAGNRSVQIHDLDSEKVLADLPHPQPCYMVAWHPDGKCAVSGPRRCGTPVSAGSPRLRLPDRHRSVGNPAADLGGTPRALEKEQIQSLYVTLFGRAGGCQTVRPLQERFVTPAQRPGPEIGTKTVEQGSVRTH